MTLNFLVVHAFEFDPSSTLAPFHSSPYRKKIFEPLLSHLYRQCRTHDTSMLSTTRYFLKAPLLTNPARALPFFIHQQATIGHASPINRPTLRSCRNPVPVHQFRKMASSNHPANPDNQLYQRTNIVCQRNCRLGHPTVSTIQPMNSNRL